MTTIRSQSKILVKTEEKSSQGKQAGATSTDGDSERLQESRAARKRPLMVGLDLGTNTTCIQASLSSSDKRELSETIPTIVGYAEEGILNGILPDDASVLFGKEALNRRIHLNLKRPLSNGIINDLKPARDFAQHLKERLKNRSNDGIRAVVGVPARADNSARERVRSAVKGVFDKVILIPEPFLAALGYRDESRLGEEDYVDPVKNSLFIDIGAGSTDLCLVQGYYPLGDDQVSIDFAGDAVDERLLQEILNTYPDCQLSLSRVKEIKEEHSFVGPLKNEIEVEVLIGGKVRRLQVGDQVGRARPSGGNN